MKRFTGWTIALAATALIATPGATSAQQAPPSPPSTTSRPAGDQGHPASHEHLTQAKAALNDIPAASLTGPAKDRVGELKRRVSALEKSAGAAHTAARPSGPGSANWMGDVAAIDRILTELLDGQTATGTTGAAGAPSAKAKGSASVTLDETARTKLAEVRTHITAFAAAMGGPSGEAASATHPDASRAASAAASAAAGPTPPTPTEPAPTTSPTEPAQRTSPTEPAQTTPPTEPAQPTPPASPATEQAPPPTPGAATQPEAGAPQVDADSAKRHLTAARDALSQLTQLPAAAQLTGDARTQVSQLITNFNELITTNTEWRASYAKVVANLTALVGDQRTDESPATPATGTPGAVGTSGTMALDPAIRAKLVEFRTHLLEFEKAAAGGAATPAPTDSPAAAPGPSATTTSAPTPSATATSAAAPGNTTAPGSASESPSSVTSTASSAAAAGATGTTGSSSEIQRPAGTSGTTADPQSAQRGHAEAMRHIDAIETLLNASAPKANPESPVGTAGTTAERTAGFDRDQIEQIRTHLSELRRLMSQSGGR